MGEGWDGASTIFSMMHQPRFSMGASFSAPSGIGKSHTSEVVYVAAYHALIALRPFLNRSSSYGVRSSTSGSKPEV